MEFITMELRPRLQSCNIFIGMRQDFRFKKTTEIKLSESSIVLVLDENRIINFSLPSVKVIPTSLSALNVTRNWIYFRLQMAPLESVFGSFTTEIIRDSSRTIESTITHSPPILNDIKSLFKLSECNILCTCCKNIISKSINFKRFLPLPDTKYDPYEWFCCKHTLNTVPNDIQPRETDYLYGSCFSMLHKDIFVDNVRVKDRSTLTCSKCSLHIGMLYTYGLFKVWNCCIDYKSCNDPSSTVNATDPFSDFLTLVKVSLSETLVQLVGEIILQTSIGKRTHYLRIRPMDRKLNLMTEPNHDVTCNIDTIFLQQKYVAKVLYKYGTDITTVIDDTNVTYHQVSLSVIEAGLKYLLSSTKRLPHMYRTVAGDDFFGYIILQETINRIS